MSNKVKIGVAVLMIGAAGVVWYLSGRADRALLAEQLESLKGQTYHVKCDACNHEFDMPAPEYLEQSGDSGVKCPSCGSQSAKRYVAPDAGIAQYVAEVASITSEEEVRAQSDEIQRQIQSIEAQLYSPEVEADEAKQAQLREQLAPLQARRQALGLRWDELKQSN